MTSLLERQRDLTTCLMTGYPELYLPGLPLVSAAASTGNATQENSCNPVTVGAKDHGSDGLFQWRLDRLVEMQDWCTAHFGDWKSIKAQAAFYLKELRDGERGGTKYTVLYQDLLAGNKSLATLTTNINRYYERSADNEAINQKRIKYAEDALRAMSGAPPVKKPAAVGGAVIVVGGAAAALSHVFTPEEIALGVSLLLNVIAVYVGWKAHTFMPIPLPSPAPPIPSMTDALRAAVAHKAAIMAELATAENDVKTQKEAVDKFITSLQDQLKAIEATP